jgi:hypothetical protein
MRNQIYAKPPVVNGSHFFWLIDNTRLVQTLWMSDDYEEEGRLLTLCL